jgi:hypothetical protein
MHCTGAKTIQQITGRMPLIMPKENLRTTPQQLIPTPRTIIGNRNLPKALSFYLYSLSLSLSLSQFLKADTKSATISLQIDLVQLLML